MPAPGTVWAAHTWDVNAWAANTWEDASTPPPPEEGHDSRHLGIALHMSRGYFFGLVALLGISYGAVRMGRIAVSVRSQHTGSAPGRLRLGIRQQKQESPALSLGAR